MCTTSNKILLLCLCLLFISPAPAHAIPAITCHCFTDRSYEPARPAAADPYFLATTQNSFFATVFNIDKKSLVMKKQQGTSPDDLWIAYWVASKSGSSANSLLQAKSKSDSWKNVIVPLRLSLKMLGVRFSGALNTDGSASQLSKAVVDEIFLQNQLLGEWDLDSLRKAGATNQELIIVTVIATKMKQPAKQLYLEVKSGTKSWGALLSAAKIDTKNMQQEMVSILKLHPQ
jgi:hypothetical protein